MQRVDFRFRDKSGKRKTFTSAFWEMEGIEEVYHLVADVTKVK